jgi:hypothetical protein
MLTMYNVGAAERDMLLRIAREARQRAWWHSYHDLAVSTIVGLEAEASSMRMYGAQLIPGLLQTESYARAVLTAVLPDTDREDIERRVQLRMKRQAWFRDGESPSLWIVIDEGALRRTVGGPESMRQQLEHLGEVADRPKVALQVLPFAAGEHAGMDGEFGVISFPEQADSDVVYVDGPLSTVFFEDVESVRHCNLLFDHLRTAALRPANSKAFLATVAKELQLS